VTPGDDDTVREAAGRGLGQRLRAVARRQRRRVFYIDVGEQAHVRVDALAEPHRLVCAPFEHALVGDARADVDVDADEVGASGRGDGDRRRPVVAEHVHPDRAVGGLADRPGQRREFRDDVVRYALGVERRVAEVLDDHRVDAAVGQSLGVAAGRLVERVSSRLGVVPRRARQRRQMHHPDHRRRGTEGVTVHTGRSPAGPLIRGLHRDCRGRGVAPALVARWRAGLGGGSESKRPDVDEEPPVERRAQQHALAGDHDVRRRGDGVGGEFVAGGRHALAEDGRCRVEHPGPVERGAVRRDDLLAVGRRLAVPASRDGVGTVEGRRHPRPAVGQQVVADGGDVHGSVTHLVGLRRRAYLRGSVPRVPVRSSGDKAPARASS